MVHILILFFQCLDHFEDPRFCPGIGPHFYTMVG